MDLLYIYCRKQVLHLCNKLYCENLMLDTVTGKNSLYFAMSDYNMHVIITVFQTQLVTLFSKTTLLSN